MPDHMRSYLDFEKPVAELEAKVDELRALAATGSDIGDEISRIADKALPGLSMVDSAGAYLVIAAEERGQAARIARSTDWCLSVGVRSVAIVTGEGMSGGAIAITTAIRVLMFEHAIYRVISPEAASSILR